MSNVIQMFTTAHDRIVTQARVAAASVASRTSQIRYYGYDVRAQEGGTWDVFYCGMEVGRGFLSLGEALDFANEEISADLVESAFGG